MKQCVPIFLWILFLPSIATAVTFDVDIFTQSFDIAPGDGVCADSNGFCSLLAAVSESTNLDGDDTINLPAGTYSVTNFNAFVIRDGNNTTTIQGAGAGITVVDGVGVAGAPLFSVPNSLQGLPRLTINDLTIQGVVPGQLGSCSGGAINNVGPLILQNVVIRDNVSASSGALGVFGPASLFNVSLINNHATADGGAISYRGPLTMNNVTISGNTAVSGAAVSYPRSCSFTGNGPVTMNNTTIVNNFTAGFSTAGIEFGPGSKVSNSIIADNHSAGNFAANCGGGGFNDDYPVSGGYNLVQGSCGHLMWDDGTNLSGDGNFISNINPFLAPLADNGGGMFSHAPLSNSPALDGGPVSGCTGVDIHGTSRPRDGDGDSTLTCDMGAMESLTPADSADLTISNTADPTEAAAGAAVIYTISIINNGPDAVSSASVVDLIPISLENATWTCTKSGEATCTAAGSGNIEDKVDMPVSSTLTYTLNTNIKAGTTREVRNLAYVGSTTASDSAPGNNDAVASVTIASNVPPQANSDNYTILEDTAVFQANDADGLSTPGDQNDDGLLANDTDGDDDLLSVTTTGSRPTGGDIIATVTVSADGTFEFVPPVNANGTTGFPYTITDGKVQNSSTAVIEVIAVNDPPVIITGSSQFFSGGLSGSQSIAAWAMFDPGPNEETQSLLDYAVTTSSDPDGVVSAIDITNDGALEFTLTGATGTAEFAATAQDNGGVENGGIATSAPVTFFVSQDTSADISISMVQCNSKTGPGFQHDYGLSVINNGPDTATGIVVVSNLPADTSVLLIDTADGSCVESPPGLVQCDIPSLENGAKADIFIRLLIGGSASGTLTHNISVSAQEDDLAAGNNSDSLDTEVLADLAAISSFESCGGS